MAASAADSTPATPTRRRRGDKEPYVVGGHDALTTVNAPKQSRLHPEHLTLFFGFVVVVAEQVKHAMDAEQPQLRHGVVTGVARLRLGDGRA